MRWFPINFAVAGRKVVVVGGGQVALRKVKSLLACGARVTVVSPQCCPALAGLTDVRFISRGYRKPDLRGACLAISATDSAAVNRRVWEHATAAGIPVNVVDQPDLCTFAVPSVLERGELVITISTGGSGPALARKIREKLARTIGPAYGSHVALLREFRPQAQAAGLAPEARLALLQRLAGDPVRRVIERQGMPAARRLLCQWLAAAVTASRS